jgi:hypothetical protein
MPRRIEDSIGMAFQPLRYPLGYGISGRAEASVFRHFLHNLFLSAIVLRFDEKVWRLKPTDINCCDCSLAFASHTKKKCLDLLPTLQIFL